MTPPRAPTCARHHLDPEAPECGSLTAEERERLRQLARSFDLDDGERVAVRAMARGLLALAAELARLRASLGTGAPDYGHEGR